MDRLIRKENTFDNHKHALYATDVTFQVKNRPSGNHEESKLYFSKKHGLYGYKIEYSVLPNGFAICSTEHHPGHKHDLEIFRDNTSFHEEALR